MFEAIVDSALAEAQLKLRQRRRIMSYPLALNNYHGVVLWHVGFWSLKMRDAPVTDEANVQSAAGVQF